MERESIYRGKGQLESAYLRLENDKLISAENKKLISKFADTWLAKGFTKRRVIKLIYWLRKLASWMHTSFDQASKEDLIALVGVVEKQTYALSTKSDMKIILKTFYKWLKGDDEQAPKIISWLKAKRKNSFKLPEELLSEDEIFKMANAANNVKDKALVLVLYETGCRIGELLSLKVKNVQFDQYGAILRVTGKTGDRRVRIISSAPALACWLDNYEGASTPEAYLWPAKMHNKCKITQCMSHGAIYVALRKLAEKAQVKKKIYPHLFRHSRATSLASKLTEAQMKEYFGWVQASDMAAVYVHLSGRDVDNALLSLQGLEKPQEKKEEQMKVKLCSRCQEKNSPISKFCTRCGTPMDIQTINQIEEQRQIGDNLLNQLMKNSEFKDFMAKKVIELGLDKQLA